MDGLGPAQRKRSLPPSIPPGVFVIGEIRQDFDAPSPAPQAGRLGLDLGTWQHSPLLRNRSSSPVIPHAGTELGALARRKGLGCGVAEPITHTCTVSKTKGKNKLS